MSRLTLPAVTQRPVVMACDGSVVGVALGVGEGVGGLADGDGETGATVGDVVALEDRDQVVQAFVDLDGVEAGRHGVLDRLGEAFGAGDLVGVHHMDDVGIVQNADQLPAVNIELTNGELESLNAASAGF